MQPIDLGEAMAAVKAGLAAAFEDVEVADAEDKTRGRIPTPAMLLQLDGLDPLPEEDDGTGRWMCNVRLSLRIVVGHRSAKSRLAAGALAGAVAALVNHNRFDVAWGPGVVIVAQPDEFAPEARELDVWAVEWQHVCALGDAFDLGALDPADRVLLSYVPEVGPPNVDKYVEVSGDG